MKIIDAHNIEKIYKGHQQALNGVSLSVDKGDAFALLGPNGAGKTTFVKALLGLVGISAGKMTLFDKEVSDSQARSKVGYLPEKFSFYPFYTVAGVLQFYGQMRGLTPEALESAKERAIESLGLKKIIDRKLSGLSKGQLQRVGIAALLMGEVELFILDEPFSGLDPIACKELKDVLLDLKQQGHTLFINSHVLSEIGKVCNKMAILNEGHMVVHGDVAELSKGYKDLEDFFYQMIQKDRTLLSKSEGV